MFGRLKIERTWGVSFYVLYYLVALPSLKGRIILERNSRESIKTGGEISAIKEVELFVGVTGGRIKLVADIDGSGGLDTYLYHIRKTSCLRFARLDL